MNEEWRSFREGTYEVSNLGNIRRAVPGISTYVGRPLLPAHSPTGYAHAAFTIGGKPVRVYVHRMVLEAFVGPCPSGHVVNHLNGDKLDNRLENLEYCTQRDNVRHALARPRRRGPSKPKAPLKGRPKGDEHWSRRNPEKVARGERGHSKLTEEQVRTIKIALGQGEAQSALARRFGISVAQMSRIAQGKRWAHVTEAA
jgi:hypothetical protein